VRLDRRHEVEHAVSEVRRACETHLC
jgi:hypothetical protein